MAEPSNSNSRLRQVMDIHTPMWMSMPGVVAVGLGEDCIKVYFSDTQTLQETSIPDEIENLRVAKVVSGEFEAQ